MVTIKAGGRELALVFNIDSMDELEERLGVPIDLTNLRETIVDKLTDRHTLLTVIYTLARQGEFMAGCEPDFDETWLKRHIKPGRQMPLHASVVQALAEGLMMETAEGDDDEDVDVVLEEIKKKQGPSASASGA